MTRDFLRDILYMKAKDMKAKEMREKASRCLHHFPFLTEHGAPMFSRDPYTNEDGSSK